MSAHLILLILALVCFVVSALGVPTPRINLVAAGLALWVAAQLLTR
jgi:hypothetical protein